MAARRGEAEARISFITCPGKMRILQRKRDGSLCEGARRKDPSDPYHSAYFLDDHGFLILAEKAAEGVGDFADRSVGFDGVEDGREKIFRCVGTALEFGKGGGHAVRIATGAESFEPGDLRALDFFVNAQRGNLPGFFADEIV